VIKELEVLLKGKDGLTALEVGVGPLGIGFLAVHAFIHLSRIVGVEPLTILDIELDDKVHEKYAKELQQRVKIIKSKGENLPFNKESFDISCSINVIDHAQSPEYILDEMARVTKHGGILVLSVSTLSFMGRIKWRFLRAIKSNKFLFVAHPHIFSWTHVRRKLQSANWAIHWENKPSLFQRFAGHGRMSFWIVHKMTSSVQS
jgi:ubiquinone/menaquinone biosynthesis C-methylase UbiE